ncbi:hypothetical protein HG531_005087 [Fusarium graminearum]|nr:hypothetical protein HG531_005087 [Fusarium graminearum]
MVMMITAPQRRLLVLLSTFFFVFSIFYCCSRLASLSVGPKIVEEPDPVPQVDLLKADNPMSYGMYNRPTYDGIDLVRNLPSEHIPTPKNKRRLVVVGDIHGMLDPFEKLLKKIKFNPETDHVIAVGDMINKGPKSSEVIARLMEIKASAVRGNHEDRVILAWRGLSSQQGVAAYLESESAAKHRGEGEDLKTARSLTEPQMTWLKRLPVILSAEPMALYFVHAGLVPGVPLPQQDAWAVMNMRTLRFPREEFRRKEIEKKRKQAEKQRQKELEKAQQDAAASLQRRSIPGAEGANSKDHVARAEPAEVDPASTASSTDENVDLERTNPDRDIWLPIDGHEGERWTKMWNKEQKKLPGHERRSVVYGHDAKMGYQEDSYTFGLDSGCVKGNALTALVVQANEEGGWKHSTHQVTCKKGELLLEDALEGDSIGSELANTLSELLNSHLVLVEVEAEESLVLDSEELRRSSSRDSQVVTASELGDLASVAERGAHDNGVVSELLVVVEDLLNRQDTRVLLFGVLLLGRGLEPVKDTADEGRNEVSTSLSSTNGLDEREHKSKVGVDAVVTLEDLGSLDTLPGSSNLDQDAVLGDTLLAVELWNCVESLVDGSFGVERVTSVDLGGDLAGDDLENLLAELNEEAVEGIVNLLVDRATLLLSVVDGDIDQLGVLLLLGGSEDERRVGGSILRLVLANGC